MPSPLEAGPDSDTERSMNVQENFAERMAFQRDLIIHMTDSTNDEIKAWEDKYAEPFRHKIATDEALREMYRANKEEAIKTAAARLRDLAG